MARSQKPDTDLHRAIHEISDLYHHAPCGYHSLDTNGVYVRINNTELNWLGYTNEEIVGQKRFIDLTNEEGRQVFERNFPILKAKGHVSDIEFDLTRKDGSTFRVLLNATAITDADGNFVMSRSTLFDISERKIQEKELENHLLRLEELVEIRTSELRRINHELEEEIAERSQTEMQLRYQEEQYRLLFHKNPQPMWIYDQETLAFLEVNQAAVNQYGYSFEEFLSMTLKDIRPPEDIPLLLDDIAHTTDTINRAGAWRHVKKNGEIILVEIVSHSTQHNGRAARHVMITDITERQRFEQELILAKEKAQESDRLKSSFLANMSHEIRTPLNSILGFSELLNDPETDPEERYQYTNIIVQSGNQLLSIITDIVDFSRIESGSININKSIIPVASLIAELYTIFRPQADEKGLTLHTHLPDGVSVATLYSDRHRILQIMTNLVSNAIKFTDTGMVELGVTLNDQTVDLLVKDTGIGIEPAYHQAIFERFRQVDETHSRKYGGTGLGLAISKGLAKRLGGTLIVESESGTGSTFTLSLPRDH